MVCVCYSREWLWCVCVTPESGYGVYVLLQSGLWCAAWQSVTNLLICIATVQEMYSAVHCALASEFILSRKSPTEVSNPIFLSEYTVLGYRRF